MTNLSGLHCTVTNAGTVNNHRLHQPCLTKSNNRTKYTVFAGYFNTLCRIPKQVKIRDINSQAAGTSEVLNNKI